jgi:hypothetical protein
VSDVAITPANPKPGEVVAFMATIENRGNAPTPSGVVHGVALPLLMMSTESTNPTKTTTHRKKSGEMCLAFSPLSSFSGKMEACGSQVAPLFLPNLNSLIHRMDAGDTL